MTGTFSERDIRALTTVADVRVIHLVEPGADDGSRRFSIGDAPGIRIPHSWQNPVSSLRARRAITPLLRDTEILHTMAVPALAPFTVLPGLAPRTPWLHTEHWGGFFQDRTTLRSRLALARIYRMELAPGIVAAVSPHLTEKLLDHGVSDVRTIPNIVDAPPPSPRASWPADRPLELVGVGSATTGKGPDVALAAAIELKRRGTDAHLTWVGNGPLAGTLRDTAAANGIAFTLTGYVPSEDVPRYLASADVFVLPTEAETFGLATAEALASGRPVVVGSAGALGDLVSPPRGVVVSQRDATAYADAITRILAASTGLTGEQIASEVRDGYSPEAFARRYLELYSELTGQPTADREGR